METDCPRMAFAWCVSLPRNALFACRTKAIVYDRNNTKLLEMANDPDLQQQIALSLSVLAPCFSGGLKGVVQAQATLQLSG
eukprot:4196811-Amphidinium_carterae.1